MVDLNHLFDKSLKLCLFDLMILLCWMRGVGGGGPGLIMLGSGGISISLGYGRDIPYLIALLVFYSIKNQFS